MLLPAERNVKMRSDEQQDMSSHELQKCVDVDGGIFENVMCK
jgi:hypothetical protein